MATQWCSEKCRQHTAKRIYLPAGNTPIPLYRHWEKTRPSFLETLTPIQIDDVTNGSQKGLFRRFFEKECPSFAPRMRWIDGPPQQADLALLGVGLNGHVAFHEPGFRADLFCEDVVLSEKTLHTLGLEPNTRGRTYGAGAFLKTKAILVLATGASKRPVLERLAALRAPSADFPISLLLEHPDLTFLVDRASMP